jgi:hypothetical protein
MIRFVSTIILILLLVGCESQKAPETVVISDRYSMKIPGFLGRTTDLNEDASLQYQNIFKELYIIVIDESAAEFKEALVENGLDSIYTNDLEGYSDLLMLGVNMELGNGGEAEFEAKNINGLDARVLDMDTEFDGMDIYYQFAYFKGKEHYYQLMTWCLADKKSQHQQAMEDMVNSFREL